MTPPSDAEVAEHLRAILSSSEFQEPLGHRLLASLRLWLEGLLNWTSKLSPLALAGIIAACLLVLVAMAVQVWYGLRQGTVRAFATTPHDAGNLHLDPDLSVRALCERAQALASGDRLKDAARALQQSLLLFFCHQKAVAWRPTLGDWEYLSLLDAPEGLMEFTRRTQQLAFGERPTLAGFEECLALYHRLLAERR